MPVDYSKWDNLELSDDSDIEVHPNVDKRSFIRAKQNQIHQERQQRRFDIERLKYERIINDGLLKRISSLVAALKAHAHEATSRNPGEVAFQAVMESAGKPEEDQPPKRPEGLQAAEGEENPTYSKMMVALLDQVNKALDEKKPEDRYTAMTKEVQMHENKVLDLQRQLEEKLAELEKEEKRKITSDAYHTGFDSSHVSKSTPEDKGKEEAAQSGQQKKQLELLNPNFKPADTQSKSTPDDGEEEEMEASADAKKFAQFKTNDFRGSAQFISEHPHILKESETDGLMVLAFDAALEMKDEYARQCVHQALLLQYCRQLGRDGVSLFFKRITTKDHQAQQMFYKDVQDTYMRIRNRAREIVRERTLEEQQGGVEQIQLHAMEEGTVINIRIPEKDSQDEEEQRARKIFEGFSAEMRKALESESLDEVNKVLGEMKVPEAEAMVEAFGEANILSLEEKIIDATTEEGQKELKELEKAAAAEGKTAAAEEKYDDPE